MTSVSCLVDEILNFTIFTALNLMPVKGYDTNSVLTFKKIGGNQELCQTSSLVCWELSGLLRSPCVPLAFPFDSLAKSGFPLLICITVESMR